MYSKIEVKVLLSFASMPVACRSKAEIPHKRGHGDEWRGEPVEALAPVLRSGAATEDGKAGYLAMASSAILFRMPRGSPRGGFTIAHSQGKKSMWLMVTHVNQDREILGVRVRVEHQKTFFGGKL